MSSRERLEDFLKTPYPTDDEVWSGFLAAIAGEIDDHDETIDYILVEKFVESATDEHLSKLAELYEVTRRTGESLDSFRARIKSALRSQLTSATIGEIRDVVAVLLDTDVANVSIDEPYDLEPMHINLDVAEQLDGVNMTTAEFIDTVETMVAVGVSVGILVSLEHEDVLVIGDDSEVGFDDAASETLAIGDDGVAGDEVSAGEAVGLEDAAWHRTDEIQQSVWGSGRWDIDFYNTAIAEFETEAGSVLAITATGDVDDEPSATTLVVPVDTADARIEPVEEAVWNEGRWNVDAYA